MAKRVEASDGTKKKHRGHGEGSIRERADGRWEATLDLGYDLTGKRRRKSFYGETRREVADRLAMALSDLQKGIAPKSERLTVSEHLGAWLAAVKPAVKVKTYEGYESVVRVRVVPRIGRKVLSRLTARDLQLLYADLADVGLSARSIQHTHRVMHRAFTQALRWDHIVRNPCDGVTPPRAEPKEMRVLTQPQAAAFLDATQEHRYYALYMLALSTGMRQGELLGLTWDDVDLGACRLVVRRALQRQRGAGLVFVEPKTKRSRRTIMLSQRAIAALRDHRRHQTQARLAAGPVWHDQGLVFANPTGGPLDPSEVTRVFKHALAAAGLPEVRFHDLRHTAATLLLGSGTHPKVVSEMLGHSTITLTLDTYSHLVPALHQQAADVMDALLGGAG